MKKYLITVIAVILLVFCADYAIYVLGWYIDFSPNAEVTTFVKTEGRKILVDSGEGFEEFEIRGVDMGSGIPGEWSTDFSGDKEMFLKWFDEIQEMGANTIRIYTVNCEEFYDAFYEFNTTREKPLYLLHGVWVDEHAQFSHLDAFSDEFAGTFTTDCLRMIDVVHGRRKIGDYESSNAASGTFRKDISPWVLGYIIGVEWETDVVSYTDDKYKDDEEKNSFSGNYLYTTKDASPFEAMLAEVGNRMFEYESDKYKEQRLLAFSNWPATDPFDYPEDIQMTLGKISKVDTEHIKLTDRVKSGQFASYHIYPYYPCYVNFMDDWSVYGIEDKQDYMSGDEISSYRAYLTGIANHHEMPVIISEFGIPSSRGMACVDVRAGRNQGGMTEDEQGEALVSCYRDIMESGCAGSCIFSWQDEWFKRTWNTLHAVDLRRNPYWSDYQTNEQFFGILTFDPGEEESVCTVDGIASEWNEDDIVSDENGMSVSVRYDERFIYFLVEKDGLDPENEKVYIPIDTTDKSGSTACTEFNLKFDRDADFLLYINGREDSHLYVQERYDAARSTYAKTMYGFDTYLTFNIPNRDSSSFVPIMFPLQAPTDLIYGMNSGSLQCSYETGKLLYGTSDPSDMNFNSISDFCFGDGVIEIRLPWQLLNFSDPSTMEIHNDYYENYGVEYLKISSLFIGAGTDGSFGNTISLSEKKMSGWDTQVHYRERLKKSYYSMQEIWTASDLYEKEAPAETKTVTLSAETEVPAIMYHDFVKKPAERGEYAIWTEDFEEDLKYLKENGYTAVSASDYAAYLSGEKDLPEKSVLLTIDDARHGVYTEAFPLLVKYGMTANVAVIGEYADNETIQASKGTRAEFFCTWDELKEMQDAGAIEIISHTYGLHDDDDADGSSAKINDYLTAANDYLKLHDTAMRNTGKAPKAMSYPLSVRDADSDRVWAETGYRFLFCGDQYALRDFEDIVFETSRDIPENIRLVPRLSREENDIEYYIDFWKVLTEKWIKK